MYNPFPSSFTFTNISALQYRHTDASRGSQCHFLAMIYEGTARITFPDGEIPLNPGDVFYIPRGCPYHSYWYGESAIRWASIGFIHAPFNERYALQVISADEGIRRTISDLCTDGGVDCGSVGRLYMLFDKLLPSMKKSPSLHSHTVIDEAERFMAENPDADICTVSKQCGISESGLYSAFRHAGTTPALTRQRLMIEKALTLLSTTDLTADEIAERSGFNSTSYFLRTLKKLTGKTTREHRMSSKMR